MIPYTESEHDQVLLDLALTAKDRKIMDGPSDPDLKAALAVAEYTEERTVASIICGLKSRGVEFASEELICALIGGKQMIGMREFEAPLRLGSNNIFVVPCRKSS